MYDTSSFLKYAKSELRLDIRDSSISQAKDLIERVRRNRFVHEEGYVFIPESIKLSASQISGFRVGIGRSAHNLPPVKIRESAFYSALMEIFQNAIEHGIQNYVGVQAKRRGSVVLLRFKNKVSPRPSGGEDNDIASDLGSRGLGLKGVMEWMSKDGIDIHIVESQKSFVVEMYIPIGLFYFEGSDEGA